MCNKVPFDHPFSQRPPYYSRLIARSHENRSWLITADWIWPNDGYMTCPGHSVIYDPDGREIARSHVGKEQFLITEISRNCLFEKKGRRGNGSPLLLEELEKLLKSPTNQSQMRAAIGL